ncbi:hypothetical protein AB0M36_22340 [Actinoplanes sp. NPDC051346]|uniref:hypothetical protein n=1 Tax=Actinoplanes sp. NPDC051346 TaxID=3155048 RepID=UPI0034421B2E
MSALEGRLRAALDARARSVTAEDLAPAVPPTAMALRRRFPAGWRLGAAAVGAAAALALVGLAVFPAEHDSPVPSPPGAPGAVYPSGSPGSSDPSPWPEPSLPSSPSPLINEFPTGGPGDISPSTTP